ncbi:MAG TPA: bifunctional (p)ppGpp synthetase/guanosine-3',5'-bis(diphosphate) 3'-pyrophosphohydrolase [Candidatus Megaira endosymbiont of Nemacystus decipiens]|nr:bifunctional (p)ppGpp synthetase/guanosine-3',5'-bis(diphosphate) 3'-pyrophosphohydrolase [Candidatus Megaera endosymbiont of Nemacystus decipiens]
MSAKVDCKAIIKKYKSYGAVLDESMVEKAINFAVKYHGPQLRASGQLYYHHPIEVAEIVSRLGFDSESIVTAILHDTIEDTDLTYEDIEKHFSPDVAKLVDGVTKLTKIEFKRNDVRQAENFRKLLIAMSDDIRVLIVKLADRLHNMRTIDYIARPAKRERIALETMEIYAPLAERIGMQAIKVELQDICFRILHPNIRKSIVDRLQNVSGNNDNIINEIIIALKETISGVAKNLEVSGRRKTPYSVWMKMKQKNITVEQLSDVIAFRIITSSIEECYRILGIIHSNYKMVPNCFQDFISTPKNNGYQSLHTVVIGPLNCKIEIQIRTKEMHEVAELGLAAHWRYKQGHKDNSDGKKYTWVRELLSILEHNPVPEEFLKNTKLAMYYDQVFCFTPKGDVISLPKGATTVDFAYTVHSDIGNKCSKAKVNGILVPLKTELENGDQVEIITSQDQNTSPAWEKFVITGKARSEIRKVLKLQQHGQYVKLGHNILSKALKSEKISDEEKIMDVACKFFEKSREELFYAIGIGLITREEVLKQILPKKNKINSAFSLLSLKRKKQNNNISQEYKVPINGLISGIAMHFAKCCHPLPGDDIVGIIHTGSGVTIHLSDCQLLKNFSSMKERVIPLTWDNNTSNIPFIGCIDVSLVNEPSGLSSVSSEIARAKGNITNFKIMNRSPDFFEIRFYVEVTTSSHLEQIINALKMKKLVQQVKKVKY